MHAPSGSLPGALERASTFVRLPDAPDQPIYFSREP